MLRAKRSSHREAAVFGEELSPPGYRGRIHPRYDCDEMRESLAAGRQILEGPGIRFLDSSRNRVGVLGLSGPGGRPLECVVKEFRPRGIDRLKSAVLASKAVRAWRGSLLLKRAGVKTPFPVAYLESRRGPFLDHALFVALAVTEAREIREPLRTLQGETLDQLVSSLAAFVKMCHRKGVWHRDLSDGNILIGEGAPSAAGMVLLDTNRIREKNRIATLRGVKNLIRLGVPARSQRKFLGTYLSPDPWSPGLWMWYRLNKMMFSAYMELKSKLRIRELVRRLKIQ